MYQERGKGGEYPTHKKTGCLIHLLGVSDNKFFICAFRLELFDVTTSITIPADVEHEIQIPHMAFLLSADKQVGPVPCVNPGRASFTISYVIKANNQRRVGYHQQADVEPQGEVHIFDSRRYQSGDDVETKNTVSRCITEFLLLLVLRIEKNFPAYKSLREKTQERLCLSRFGDVCVYEAFPCNVFSFGKLKFIGFFVQVLLFKL